MHVEQPLALLINPAGETKRQRVIASCELRRQGKRQQFVFLVDLDCGNWQFFSIDRRCFDLEFERVQHELTNRTTRAQLNCFTSGKREIVDVRNNAN